MRGTFSSRAWGSLARVVALGAGAWVLAGCATGYAFVQPDVAGGGGYYTSDGPYPGPGYGAYYGAGPYYPGTGGYGYYHGTYPYADPFGWYGGLYGNYGYWPSFGFNLGISNGWNFPGYRGPWYSTGWGCARWRCGHDGRGRHHHHDDHDPVTSGSPRPWLEPDHPPVPPGSRGAARSDREPARPMERFANRRPLPSARFAPRDFVRVPVDRMGSRTSNRTPAPDVAMPRMPAETGFAHRRPGAVPPARPDFRAAVPPVWRPAPRVAAEPEFVNRRPAATPFRPVSRAPVPLSRPAPAASRPVQAARAPANRARAANKVENP